MHFPLESRIVDPPSSAWQAVHTSAEVHVLHRSPHIWQLGGIPCVKNLVAAHSQAPPLSMKLG